MAAHGRAGRVAAGPGGLRHRLQARMHEEGLPANLYSLDGDFDDAIIDVMADRAAAERHIRERVRATESQVRGTDRLLARMRESFQPQQVKARIARPLAGEGNPGADVGEDVG